MCVKALLFVLRPKKTSIQWGLCSFHSLRFEWKTITIVTSHRFYISMTTIIECIFVCWWFLGFFGLLLLLVQIDAHTIHSEQRYLVFYRKEHQCAFVNKKRWLASIQSLNLKLLPTVANGRWNVFGIQMVFIRVILYGPFQWLVMIVAIGWMSLEID